jgi:hypothetical protein
VSGQLEFAAHWAKCPYRCKACLDTGTVVSDYDDDDPDDDDYPDAELLIGDVQELLWCTCRAGRWRRRWRDAAHERARAQEYAREEVGCGCVRCVRGFDRGRGSWHPVCSLEGRIRAAQHALLDDPTPIVHEGY